MSKKTLSLVLFIGLLCFAGLVLADDSISPTTTATSFSALFGSIAKAIAGIIGGVGAIMFIVAGIFYVTSGGSPERMGVAKKTLVYAIIGMVVGLSANAIVDFVVSIAK